MGPGSEPRRPAPRDLRRRTERGVGYDQPARTSTEPGRATAPCMLLSFERPTGRRAFELAARSPPQRSLTTAQLANIATAFRRVVATTILVIVVGIFNKK